MTLQTAPLVTWSKSQMANLKECRRKYYLNIKTTDAAESNILLQQAALLKKVKNRYLWVGSMIHEEIGQILKLVRQGNPIPEQDSLIASVREKMRTQFKVSREGGAAHRLFEHEYEIALNADLWRKQWDTVERSLRWFLNSKWLKRLASLGPECWKTVDEILAFDVGGTKAYVKVDCAVEIEGRFFLMDWKTSTPNQSAEESLHVAALYAHEVWEAEAGQIEALAISVLDGATHHAHIDEETLMETFLRIEEQTAVLEQARIDVMKTTTWTDLPPASMDTCQRCSYQKLCHPQGLGSPHDARPF